MVQLQATGPDVSMSAPAIATLLGGDVGRKLGMHVVAATPLYLNPQQVPKEVLERETAIFRYVAWRAHFSVNFCRKFTNLCAADGFKVYHITTAIVIFWL